MSPSRLCLFVMLVLALVSVPSMRGIGKQSPPPEEQRQDSMQGAAAQPQENGKGQTAATGDSRLQQNRQPDLVLRIDQQSNQANESGSAAWVHLILGLVLPWPLLIVIAVSYLMFSKGAPSRIELLLSPFQSLKLFGQEFVLNTQGGKNVEAAIAFYRKKVQQRCDAQVIKLKLAPMHVSLVNNYITPQIPDFAKLDIRSTIYIADVLFADSLYQLLDYYPLTKDPGRGRAFSARFGMIGKAWRFAASQYASSVPTTEEELILQWGMTREEADKAGQGRQSFGCVILKSAGGAALALLYLDSPVQNAFGDRAVWDKLERAAIDGARQTRLIGALETLSTNLLSASPRVRIYSGSHVASS